MLGTISVPATLGIPGGLSSQQPDHSLLCHLCATSATDPPSQGPYTIWLQEGIWTHLLLFTSPSELTRRTEDSWGCL